MTKLTRKRLAEFRENIDDDSLWEGMIYGVELKDVLSLTDTALRIKQIMRSGQDMVLIGDTWQIEPEEESEFITEVRGMIADYEDDKRKGIYMDTTRPRA